MVLHSWWDNSLTNGWEEFKVMFIDFCTFTAIEDLRKFKGEKWSSYLSRLYEFGMSRGIKVETILNKLCKEKSPHKI